jgi:hypothetical protein
MDMILQDIPVGHYLLMILEFLDKHNVTINPMLEDLEAF